MQLKSQALSLLKDHRDLTRDLNCFLLHICPPPSYVHLILFTIINATLVLHRTPDVYEEIKLLDGCTEKVISQMILTIVHCNSLQLDEFENITIASGKRKNKTNDSKRAPKGKKKKKTNEGIR